MTSDARTLRVCLALVLLLSACARLDDESQVGERTRTLDFTSAGAPLSRAFTQVSGVRELPDGRVLVSDASERVVVLADFEAQTVAEVGHRGAGPGEYALPRSLVALREGRTILADPGNARFIEFDSTGSVLRTFIPGTEGTSAKAGQALSLSATWDIRGSDARGFLYFEQLPGPLQPGQSHVVPVIRWDVAAITFDTVATYVLSEEALDLVPEVSGEQVLVRPRAWPYRPQWAVSPEGQVAVVMPNPYRVVWFDDGRETAGSVVEYQPIPVTEADRQAFSEAAAAAPRGPSGTGQPSPVGTPTGRRKVAAEPLFPEVKPPFVGREAVLVDPDNILWVRRTPAEEDSRQTYDLFDRFGARTGTAVLPQDGTVIGFGSSTIYIVIRDQYGLQHLHRVSL